MMTTALTTAKFTKRMPDLADYIPTEEAAQKLGYHVIYIRRMLREGKLKGIKVGPTWLVSRASVDDYQKANKGMDKNDPRRGQ